MMKNTSSLGGLKEKPWLPYVLPFLVFLFFTEPARFFPGISPYLYVTKTFLVGAMLWFWRGRYCLDFSSRLSGKEIITASLCGILVMIIWIVPEEHLVQVGRPSGFDPYGLGESQAAVAAWIGIRLFGSSLVVPVMEELFWRSFLMRYLINPDFRSVSIGAFSWFSFLGVAILFGFEHHRVVVGIFAGLLYGLLLVWQKNLKGVILAHGVTNFGLGIYVLTTKSWMFW